MAFWYSDMSRAGSITSSGASCACCGGRLPGFRQVALLAVALRQRDWIRIGLRSALLECASFWQRQCQS